MCKYKNLNSKKNFKIIGSAHNSIEIKNKEIQGCSSIGIAPLFKTKNQEQLFFRYTKFNF